MSTVKNKTISVSIREQGRLIAKKRTNLYAEVQGIMKVRSKEFKIGVAFKKGEIMIEMANDAYYANLQAQKSILQNLITSILPDLRLDYPKAYEKWGKYLDEFELSQPLRKSTKNFLGSRKILYHREKYFYHLLQHQKFRINLPKAPY